MNKTVTINISGIIFHIEEDAYDKLGNYLGTVRNRFSEEDGRDEIMSDIESRIAEILNERVGPSKQVVLMHDVDHVISLMGEPDAISDKEEKTENNSAKEEKPYERGPNGRRRLYRDTDDKVFGGVCSGLGYYFDLDPIWIRLGFVAIFFAFGTGILFYILLLIIMPKAETTSEKLEMRGEPIDVNNISKTVKEEFDGFKKRAKDFGNEAKQYGKRWKDESRDWTRRNRVRGGFEEFFHGVFHVIGRILGFALLIFGIFFLIGLLTSTFSLSNFGPAIFGDTISSFFPDGLHYTLAIISFLLVFGIPILMMIYKGIRIIFRIKRSDRAVGISALVLWIIGIAFGIFSGMSVGRGFTEKETVHETFLLKNPHRDTLYLNVNVDPDMENEDYHTKYNHKYHFEKRWKAVSINGSTAKFGYPQLQIIPTEGDSIELVVFKHACGREKKEAMERARSIDYLITQKDSLLTFNSFFTLGPNQSWRAQSVRMELRVPIGTVIFLSGKMAGILDDVENTSNALDEEMGDRRWRMTEKGLDCIDCAGLEISERSKSTDFVKPKPADTSKAGK